MSEKERVLLVNKFYYPRGGDCIQMMNVEHLLKMRGHEVAVFSMQYPQNNHSEYTDYFPTEVEFSGGIKSKISAAARVLGYGGVKNKFENLIKQFSPDVVHLHNIHSYISPIVAEIAKERGCRVVWTLHDYKLGCPSYSCLSGGKPCELCFTDKANVIKKRCMKGSLPASIMAYIEAEIWNIKRLCRATDTFICPSRFMSQAMQRAGIPSNKLEVLNNFIDNAVSSKHSQNVSTKESRANYYCYVGRISEEKGIETLLQAASALPYQLKVAGTGPKYEQLKNKYTQSNIEFLGQLGRAETMILLSKARFSVLPSEWYENNPLGIIESLSLGTPVVGAEIGGIPELINETNGKLFKPFDTENLRQAITETYKNEQYNYTIIADDAQKRYSPENYYNRLIEIYNNK